MREVFRIRAARHCMDFRFLNILRVMASTSPILGARPNGVAPAKADVVRIIESNRLACEYQPIVEIETGEIWAYEALSRFHIDGELIEVAKAHLGDVEGVPARFAHTNKAEITVYDIADRAAPTPSAPTSTATGCTSSEVPTPKTPTTWRVMNSWITSEMTFRFEYQKPRKAASRSSSWMRSTASPPWCIPQSSNTRPTPGPSSR